MSKRLFIVTLLLFAVFPALSAAHAACSPHVGRATINELYRGNNFFLELKILDPSLNTAGWTVQLCSEAQWLGCTGSLPLTAGTISGPYMTFATASLNRDYLDFSKNDLDVLLLDNLGQPVDYLSVNGYAAQSGSCATYAYPTTINGNSNSFNIIRDPDGNGPWIFYGSGNSEPETPGDPNTDNPDNPLPRIDGTEIVVARGDPAVFTLTLDQTPSATVTASYQTVADTALDGVHFVPSTGTVTFTAGSTSASVTVQTIAGSPPPDGASFLVELTNPSGAHLNTHFLRATLTAGPAQVDHYRISHPGDALTCQRAAIEIRACENADCSSLYTGETTVDLSPSGSVTFNGGSGILQLRHTTPGALTLGIAAASPPADDPHFCFGGPAGAPCQMTFHETGFVFDVPVLTACQDSAAVSIRAVRMDDTTQACVADGGFAGTTRTVAFWTNYLNPAGGSRTLTLNGQPLATAAPGTPVDLSFDSGAASSLVAGYRDAGLLQLTARFEGSGEEAGLVMTGGDTFAVRPDRLNVLVTGAGSPLDNTTDSGAPHWPAGQDFRTEVEAVCSDGTRTPNFAADVALSAVSPHAPAGGVLGSLLNGTLTAADFSGGTAARDDVGYSEVGTFTLQARTTDYLGTGPLIGSTAVGRFTPHHFDVSAPMPEFGTACAAGGFTYIGEPFQYTVPPVITLTAKNAHGSVTRNYTGPWWKVTPVSLGATTYAAEHGTLDLGLLPAVDPLIADSGNGLGTLTFGSGGGIAFNRGAPEDPFNAEIGLSIHVADADGITPAVNPVQFADASAGNGISFDAGKEMRYGRLRLLNAYGSELLPLTVPLRAEYFSGGDYAANLLDQCTPYAGADLVLGPYVALAPGDTTGNGSGSLVSGAGNGMRLSAPGKEGSVDVSLPVPDWLQDEGADPAARASFGIFKGNARMIYLREVY